MTINNEMMNKLADLSYLNITAEELPSLRKSLESMLGLMNTINEVQISELNDKIVTKRTLAELPEVLPALQLKPEAALLNVKNSKNDYILVPKIIQH